MSIIDRLFRRAPAGPPLDVAALQARLAAAAARRAGRPPAADLVRARLADACRDAGMPPAPPEVFDELARGLDDEAARRLALAVDALDEGELRRALPCLPAIKDDGRRLVAALRELARETPLLTLELLRDGPLRAEEFARQLIVRLGASVRGESADQSRRRLERLDYGRLLAEAEQARQSAEGRVKKLRELQDEQEKRRPRRGKW